MWEWKWGADIQGALIGEWWSGVCVCALELRLLGSLVIMGRAWCIPDRTHLSTDHSWKTENFDVVGACLDCMVLDIGHAWSGTLSGDWDWECWGTHNICSVRILPSLLGIQYTPTTSGIQDFLYRVCCSILHDNGLWGSVNGIRFWGNRNNRWVERSDAWNVGWMR